MDSSAAAPLSVRVVSQAIGGWIGRLGRVWIEGQLAQVSRRPGAATVFLTLRDTVADMSLSVTMQRSRFDNYEPPLTEGTRVVVWAQPQWYPARGQLTLAAYDVRPVGVGELLARLENLKRVLVGEGLTDAARKKPLPFLPAVVGLVTGRASAAERDVVENAQRRWPGVVFRTLEVQVQGVGAVTAVMKAVAELDADPAVEVIVIARGGGSLEDLLPFSDEALCRLVAAASTPIVSAIGHEVDSPLLDLVADWRASTPTDAGKRVVPDVAEEIARISRARASAFRCVRQRVTQEQARLDAIMSRPSIADPASVLDTYASAVAAMLDRVRRTLSHRFDTASSELDHTLARVRSLSPQATLDRGYAVVQSGNAVVRDAAAVASGTPLQIRLAKGTLDATSA